MKHVLKATLFLALLGSGVALSLPSSARVDTASNLQLSVNGRQAVGAMKAGCTRITNRFCVQSTRSNCSACL